MKQEARHTKDAVNKIFTEYLDAHSLRKTPERFAILDMIYDNMEGHFNIEQLYNKLIEAKYPISRATLYNNISLLIEANLLVSHHINSNLTEYERSFNTGMHSHMICSICGKVKEFSDKNVFKAIENINTQSFLPSHFSLYIYGTCSRCQKKMLQDELKKIQKEK